ncbi:MAG: hypothetical protein AAF675_02850 [Pseudomonadota bacterium]
MDDVTSQERSPAVERLRRYGWVSTALGAIAASICTVLYCLTEHYTAMTGLALGGIALQLGAVALLFLPAFSAFRTELREGAVRVDRARERAAMRKPPLWVILVLIGMLAINLVAGFLREATYGGSLLVFMLAFLTLFRNGWPSMTTPAQQAMGAAALGMFGLMLSMMPGMMAGGYLERSGAIDVPEGVAILGFTALMVIPAFFVFFSTVAVIGRASHAH